MSDVVPVKPQSNNAGLASLILTLVELLRQLMEAQVIRRIDKGSLSESEIERAAESLQAMEAQILNLCETLEINPADLNLDLGEVGKLLPQKGEYYPDQPSQNGTVLELLDRLISTGVVLEGDAEVGIAQVNLIKIKLRIMLSTVI
jgi:Gas vesicle protein K/Gas vesicle protein